MRLLAAGVAGDEAVLDLDQRAGRTHGGMGLVRPLVLGLDHPRRGLEGIVDIADVRLDGALADPRLVDIAVGTNSFRAVRGRAVLLAILDECAYYRDETSATPNEETYRALRPGMATLPRALLVGISSPYRKSGLLYAKFKKHFGRDDDDVLVVRAPTAALNPTIDPAIIAAAIEDDPAAAKAETWPRAGGASFFLGSPKRELGGMRSQGTKAPISQPPQSVMTMPNANQGEHRRQLAKLATGFGCRGRRVGGRARCPHRLLDHFGSRLPNRSQSTRSKTGVIGCRITFSRSCWLSETPKPPTHPPGTCRLFSRSQICGHHHPASEIAACDLPCDRH
jgi:hypothetical protein